MAKRIETTGKANRRIEVAGKPQRRVEPAEFAASMGAEPLTGVQISNLDPVSLSHIGSEIIARLRSSGGRPALSDATEICRVPLSVEDVKALEEVTDQLARTTGCNPSTGQVASIAVRRFLNSLAGAAQVVDVRSSAEWSREWNGSREKYRSAQEVILRTGTTWGMKGAA